MNPTSRPVDGPPHPGFNPPDLRDILARVVAAREELDYEPSEAAAILADLEDDLAALIVPFGEIA